MIEYVYDTWLSKIIQKDCYNIFCKETTKKFEFIKKKNSFFTAKIESSDFPKSLYLQKYGFKCIDYHLTFNKKLEVGENISACRFYANSDKCHVLKLSNFFNFSRFHMDPEISSSVASKIKREWVKSFFLGKRGDNMIVFEEAGNILGFLLFLIRGEEIIIDLIIVDEKHRRKNIAKKMIDFMVKKSISKRIQRVKVGTQSSNLNAIKFYSKLGFSLSSINIILHKHI
tara:strand:- start:1018 stop:1701 length:684 start_codon:yes stop_codon:yes gene_type:complete